MESISDKELARFGHTIDRINHYEYLVFGGAIENNDNTYVTTNDTFVINKDTLQWRRIQSNLTRCWCYTFQ